MIKLDIDADSLPVRHREIVLRRIIKRGYEAWFAADRSLPDVMKAIEEDALPWTHVSDLQRRNAASQQFGVSAIPDNFLIDPDGIVIARGLRDEALMEKLEEVFKDK